ncbi:MAG: hypothetical protein ACRCZP_01920, partial [Phycicoccus sp.]
MLVAAEASGRWWAAERMRDHVFSETDPRDSEGQVDVDLGRWPVVLQALTGRLGRVELSAEDAVRGWYEGDFEV